MIRIPFRRSIAIAFLLTSMITLTLVSCSGDGNDATTGQPATSTDGNANSDNTAN